MAYLPPVQSNEIKNPSGAKKSPAGFLYFIKKITRFLGKTKKTADNLRIKRDINKLEYELSKEHTELLRQRRFYEKLLHRGYNSPDNFSIETGQENLVRNTKAVKDNKTNSRANERVFESPKSSFKKEALYDKATYQRPSSQDIYALAKKPEIDVEELELGDLDETSVLTFNQNKSPLIKTPIGEEKLATANQLKTKTQFFENIKSFCGSGM